MIIFKGCKTCGGDVIVETSMHADSRCLQCGRTVRQTTVEPALVEIEAVAPSVA